MPPVYRIKDWDQLYETAETRKLENLRWAPIPNKHDGLGFRRVAQQRNRAELLAGWVLLVQVASKGRRGHRGLLERDGRALDAEDLELMTGFPADLFQRALSFFSDPKQGWLVADATVTADMAGRPATGSTAQSAEIGPDTTARRDGTDLTPDESPSSTAESPASPASPPAEGKGMEGREGKEKKEALEPASALTIPLCLNAPSFLAPWDAWCSVRRKGKKPKSSWTEYFEKQLAWLEPFGLETATEIVAHSARNEYQGLFEPRAGQRRNPNQPLMR